MKDFKGMCVPIVTPFAKDGNSVDEGALKSHIDWMIESGVDIILACGGTGEFAYLREAERRRVSEVTCKHVAGRAHVFLQTSAINTADTIDNSKAAADMGADAIMVLPPYFEGPTMDGVMWHYEKVAKSVKLPIVVYNIPQNTNIDITPEIFTQLMKIENIQYIKDSTVEPGSHPAARRHRRKDLQRRRSHRLPGPARRLHRLHLGRHQCHAEGGRRALSPGRRRQAQGGRGPLAEDAAGAALLLDP